MVLGIEAILHVRILLSKISLVPVMSWLWFLAYCLANLLFGLHILMYFTFQESVSLSHTHLRIEQGLAGISSVTLIPIERILCASLCESTLGTKHITVLWQDDRFRTQNSTIGTCLRREHSHALLNRLKQAVLLSEDLAA